MLVGDRWDCATRPAAATAESRNRRNIEYRLGEDWD